MLRSRFVRVALPALFVFACLSAFGGHQWRYSEGSLSTDGRSIELRDGRLVATRIMNHGYSWKINAPYIFASDELLVARDPKDKVLDLTFIKKKGPPAEWSFEILETIKPHRDRRSDQLHGEAGLRFRVLVPDGPFRGWYIGLGPEAPRERFDVPGLRPLFLVKKADQAAEFRFIRTRYEVR